MLFNKSSGNTFHNCSVPSASCHDILVVGVFFDFIHNPSTVMGFTDNLVGFSIIADFFVIYPDIFRAVNFKAIINPIGAPHLFIPNRVGFDGYYHDDNNKQQYRYYCSKFFSFNQNAHPLNK